MNPVLILTHNCLELTKKCAQSVRDQDIPTQIMIVDNGSTDGSVEWIESQNFDWVSFRHKNDGVSSGWNLGINSLLCLMNPRADHVLVVNNDTILPPWFYSSLLEFGLPFVTGRQVDFIFELEEKPERRIASGGPDFSAFLIGKDAWLRIGPFDESMKFYASDCDYHLRGKKIGVPMYGSNIPYFHERSSTLKNAPKGEREEISRQADLDREKFRLKWGFSVGSPEYGSHLG